MLKKYNSALYAFEILIICLLFFALITILCVLEKSSIKTISQTNAIETEVNFIIDAGHGGRDGGAVSKVGILEKDLNLSVAKTLNDILNLCGAGTVMTRDSDNLVCDENDPSLKGKIKTSDLKNRLNISNEYPSAVFVSIHMNNFSVDKYSGLQVYYSPNNEKSFFLAQNIQESVCKVMQPENNRKVKKAGSGIFLLNRIQSPAILIECGFLSNNEEAKKLNENAYQTSLSLVFADVLLSNLT